MKVKLTNLFFERTNKFSIVTGLFAAVSGALAMLGWLADIPRLIDWDGNAITIKFNAALALTLLGVALVVRGYSESSILLVRVPSVLALLIGSATIFQHLTNVNLGIDTLFVIEDSGALATSSPGRMGMPASTSYTFLAVALLLSTTSYRRHAAKAALISLCYALLALIGYIFGADPLYTLPKITGIALQTAISIFALSLGVISLYRESWPMNLIVDGSAGARMFRQVYPFALVILVGFGLVNFLGYSTGFYEAKFGVAFRTFLEIVFITVLLSWVGTRVTAQENEIIAGFRIRAENEARKLVAAAQESERRRLARDLHDHLGQAVTAIRFRVAYLKSQDKLQNSGGEALDEIESVANGLDRDVSLLAWELRPVMLDTHGLRTSLGKFLNAWGESRNIATEFHCPADFPRLSPDTEISLYRIVQECLTNVLKHAAASRVSVSLSGTDESIWLTIGDDGKGFNTTVAAGRAFAECLGIGGMRERAALINGEFDIESSPGMGTTVRVRVPFTGQDGSGFTRPDITEGSPVSSFAPQRESSRFTQELSTALRT